MVKATIKFAVNTKPFNEKNAEGTVTDPILNFFHST